MQRSELEALPWQEVESSNVRRVAFGARTRTGAFVSEADEGDLYVEFHGSPGRVYRYAKVAYESHVALHEADSVGGYLNAEIKPAHECERIEVEEGEG